MATIKVKIQTKEQLELLSLKELKALCKEYKFENYSKLNKTEVIDSILEFFKNLSEYPEFVAVNGKSNKVLFHRVPKSIGIKSFNNLK
jgi:transcription termination factor Rho